MRLPQPVTTRRSALIAGATALVLTSTWVDLAAADDDDKANSPRPGLSMRLVLDTVPASGCRDIDRIKWDGDGHSVRARHADRSHATLRVDPRTGELVERRRDDERYDRTKDRARKDGGGGTVECSERRCRDDLPQASTSAAFQSPLATPYAGR